MTPVEPFDVVLSMRPSWVKTVLRTTLELQPMNLFELVAETGICQHRIIAELPKVALRGRDGRYYARKTSSLCVTASSGQVER